MTDPLLLLQPLLDLHEKIRDSVVSAAERQELDELSAIDRDDEGDTIYAVDAIGEDAFMPFFEGLSRDHTFVLIAEGLAGGQVVLPSGADESAASWRIILDPIDGTRGIMYQKRSAWILTGVAPDRGPATGLQDIVLAVQTEIPLLKQHLSDQIWAAKGYGVKARRFDRLRGTSRPLELRPSKSSTIAHGFATISRFFPGGRAELAAIDDEVVSAALGPAAPGKARCFEDQYISTGGQLYELMAGHDRFIADLRPLAQKRSAPAEEPPGLCCHPYDLCSALIASELGVIITDAAGNELNGPLDASTDVAWIGYANEQIRRQIEPLLQTSLRKRGWL